MKDSTELVMMCVLGLSKMGRGHIPTGLRLVTYLVYLMAAAFQMEATTLNAAATVA